MHDKSCCGSHGRPTQQLQEAATPGVQHIYRMDESDICFSSLHYHILLAGAGQIHISNKLDQTWPRQELLLNQTFT